ncbi:MAG: methylenetetrahydrofolate reductase [Candidatus Thorarchaeota archaeon]
MLPNTHLRGLLESGQFVVTAEIGAPHDSDVDILMQRANLVKDHCDAINVADNPRGLSRMSSMACAHIVYETGAEPVMHIATRNRNRVQFQSDLFGAFALGVRNILLMTGDIPAQGSKSERRITPEIDSIRALELASTLMEGKDIEGEDLERAPSFFLGSTFDPYAVPQDKHVKRVWEKRGAGAEFFQTQAIYDPDGFQDFMDQIESLDARVLAGIVPLQGSDMAEFMNSEIPGIRVPDDYIERLRDAEHGLQDEERLAASREEGVQIAKEIIEAVRRMKGVDGIHIMGIGWEESIPQLVESTGLYPRPRRG